MNARFRHQPARRDGAAVPPASGGLAPGSPAILADRSCCCPARPVVRVIMPPTQTRPWKTDLLLCGHHYRISRGCLAAAHAAVREIPGTPSDTAAWIDLGQHDPVSPAAPVS
jgi:hypothetical protein